MKKIVIWGVKKNPPELWSILEDKYEIVGWVDKNEEFQDKYIQNIKVYSPDDLNQLSFDKVIVGAAIYTGTRQIVEDCLLRGIRKEDIITEYALKTTKMSLARLFELQHKEGSTYCFENFNRLNLLIQYAFVGQFYGKNTVGYGLAERYMKLVCEDDRRNNHQQYFEDLIRSIEANGFSPQSYISVNKKGNLIDGTHRLAIALWKKEVEVNVDIFNTEWNLGEESDRDLKWVHKIGTCFSKQEIMFLHTSYEEIKKELISKTNKEKRNVVNLWERN